MKTFCPECESEQETTLYLEVRECTSCGGVFDDISKPETATLIARVAELETAQPATCEWTLYDDDWNAWQGECGALWTLESDDPITNGMNHCPKCGRKLVQKLADEGGGEG